MPIALQTGTTIGVPFHRDLLEEDLDSHFPGFIEGGESVSWAVAIGALANSWAEFARLEGIDWELRLHPPKHLKIPVPKREPNLHTRWRVVAGNCALIIVRTDRPTLNEARDVGRVTVRALLALLRRDLPSLLLSDVIWEGGVIETKDAMLKMMVAHFSMESKAPATPSQLHADGLRLAPLDLKQIPGHVLKSLEWFYLARSARVPAEKFVHMWMSCLSLAAFGQPSRANDLPRMEAYVQTMGVGVGGVRSQASIASLYASLKEVNSIRHALIHRNDESRITPMLLADFESVVFELFDFELRKIGISLSVRQR